MQYDSFYDEDGPGYFDYNPAHAIWYLLVQAGFPEARLNSESFLAAAITIYNEGEPPEDERNRHRGGISARLHDSIGVKDYITQLLAHCNGVLTWGTDGKFHLVLIRDNYNVADLPVVNENVMLEEPMIDRESWPETYGEISIQYNKRVYPPANLKYYQEAVEVVRKGKPYVRNYQEVVEVIRAGRPKVAIYQEAVELLRQNVYACLDDITILWATSTTTTTTTFTGSTTSTTATVTTTTTIDLGGHDWTSGTNGEKSITSSSEYAGLYDYEAADGGIGSGQYWIGTTPTPEWWKIDFGVSNRVYLTYVGLVANTIPEPNRMPKDFTIQGSNNDVDWDTLTTETGETSWGSGERRNFWIGAGLYRYVKIDITANNGDVNYTQLGEVYLLGGRHSTTTTTTTT